MSVDLIFMKNLMRVKLFVTYQNTKFIMPNLFFMPNLLRLQKKKSIRKSNQRIGHMVIIFFMQRQFAIVQ